MAGLMAFMVCLGGLAINVAEYLSSPDHSVVNIAGAVFCGGLALFILVMEATDQ